jgi:hypothetical protein
MTGPLFDFNIKEIESPRAGSWVVRFRDWSCLIVGPTTTTAIIHGPYRGEP